MPSIGRVAVVLLAVGALVLASPTVVLPLVDDGPDRASQLLGARPLGETHEGTPIDETKDLVETWDHEYVLDLQRYAALSARGGTDHLACNRAVNETVTLFGRATEDGVAETTDDAVAADLQCMADAYDYYRPPDDDHRGFYTFAVTTDGGTTTLETAPVDDAELAATIREEELVQYDDLNATERRTVDRVLANSTESYGSYRPPADDPVLARTPMLVGTDEDTHVVQVIGHTDDFNLAELVVSLGLWALGGLLLLAGAVTGGVALYRRRADDRAGGARPG